MNKSVLAAVAVALVVLVIVYFVFIKKTLPEGISNGMILGLSSGPGATGPWLIQDGKKRVYDMNVWMAIQPRAWTPSSRDVVDAIPDGVMISSVAMSTAADAAVAASL